MVGTLDSDKKAEAIRLMDAATFAAMLADGGRTIGSRWYPLADTVITNCSGMGWSDRRGPRHETCEGWSAPLTTVKHCRCPCHDTYRPGFYAARAAIEARTLALTAMDDARYQIAVELRRIGATEVAAEHIGGNITNGFIDAGRAAPAENLVDDMTPDEMSAVGVVTQSLLRTVGPEDWREQEPRALGFAAEAVLRVRRQHGRIV